MFSFHDNLDDNISTHEKSTRIAQRRTINEWLNQVTDVTQRKEVLPKSSGKSASLPLTAEIAWTRPLHALYPLQSKDESNHSATGTLHW